MKAEKFIFGEANHFMGIVMKTFDTLFLIAFIAGSVVLSFPGVF